MVIVFGASHVNIWVAFIGFFLPLVMAFASRNAACLAFLETQDCIGHSQSSFLRRVISPLGDSGDGDDSDFGIPPREPPTVTAHSSIRSRKAEDGAGRKPCF